MAIVILLVATWLNFRRHIRPKVGLNLAMEGWAGDGLAGAGVIIEGGDSRQASGPDRRERVAGPSTVPEGDQGEEEEVDTGQEKIYRGILWMKEKYERYREQADRRYEQLKEELGRSERRYHELVSAMQHNRERMPGAAMVERMQASTPAVTTAEGEYAGDSSGEMAAAGGEILGEIGNGGLLVSEEGGEVLRSELRMQRRKVEELERELQTERLKAEELVIKLQANSQLLMNIYQELDKSLTTGRVAQ